MPRRHSHKSGFSKNTMLALGAFAVIAYLIWSADQKGKPQEPKPNKPVLPPDKPKPQNPPQPQPQPSAEEKELKEKLRALVRKKYGIETLNNYKKCFAEYDKNKSGEITPDELDQLLKDAGVGNYFTRGQWVAGIMLKMDTDHSGGISWTEFAERTANDFPKHDNPDPKPADDYNHGTIDDPVDDDDDDGDDSDDRWREPPMKGEADQ